MARRLGDPGTLAYGDRGLHAGQPLARLHPDAGRALDQMIAVALAAGDPSGRRRATRIASPRCSSLAMFAAQGRSRGDGEDREGAASAVPDCGSRWRMGADLASRGGLRRGRASNREGACARDGRPELERGRRPPASAVSAAARAGQARRDEDLVRSRSVDYPTYPLWRCVLCRRWPSSGDTKAPSGARRARSGRVRGPPLR